MANQTRLLIVDDEQNVAWTLKAALEENGCAVSTAGTIAEVDTLLDKEQFDVAIVDLRLGDADGIQVLKALRARQPDCGAIMLTGYASLQSAVAAIREGAYDYLIKPCDLDELKLTVKGAAERGALARALRKHLEKQDSANVQIRSRIVDLQRKLDQVTAELDQKIKELAEVKRQLGGMRLPSKGLVR